MILVTLLLLAMPTLVTSESTSNIVIHAEDAPVETLVEEILVKRRVNFVYSNSRLGIGTNRTPKIDIRVTRRAKKSAKKETSESKTEETE